MPSKPLLSASRHASKRSRLILAVALVALAVASWRAWRLAAPLDTLVAEARQALADQKYDDVEMLCRRALARDPLLSSALLLAGEAAMKQGRRDEAVEYYDRVPASDAPQAAMARLAAGSILMHANRASAAERELRAALDCNPDLALAHERLAWLLGVEGRRYESLPYLYALLQLGHVAFNSLMAAGNHDVPIDERARLQAFLASEPDNAWPLIGLARIELREDRARARRLLDAALAKMPEQVEAQALMGRVLWELHDKQALAGWLERLPAACDEHPDVWLVRGEIAHKAGQAKAAARAFWEALRRDANHQAATYKLSRLLPTLAAHDSAADDSAISAEALDLLADRARQLEELAEALDTLSGRAGDRGLIRRAATLTESLGRLWESWAWHEIARSIWPDASWIAAGLARIEPQLSPELGDTLASCDPGQRLDLSGYPLPQGRPARGTSPPMADTRPASLPTFREVAMESGVDFTYFRGCEAGAGDGRMFEFAGGGAAALDFDLDGWPDLYFTQGCRWPPAAGQTEFLDQLFRNQGGGAFRRVTAAASVSEDRFSQGAAIGDFNSDGFPDIYIANIGANRLLMNCGDGTFLDVTGPAELEQSDANWTTSCLMADLNGDGLADLYDVNYVMGDDVFERVCIQGGEPRICAPGHFTPQPDRLWLNLGDGRFADRSEASGVEAPGGNGLGVVAADFEGGGRLSLFVANDQDANFYFVNRGARGADPPRFVEAGLLSGLAFSDQGRAQASMGVAAGDANGDGRLDLFVTNFYHDSNTLYLQHSADVFEDATAIAGLAEPSYQTLGFGAQFIDGELDGLPDLVVANGHIDDFRRMAIPYAMRPQYFRNTGEGRFVELPGRQAGQYFANKHLGRALARLDFNRDGREDFVVSHLDAAAALVANETRNTGHFLALRLCGMSSARDAIGARVTVAAGGRSFVQQLTAGDGYMASNQRQLVFGLGPAGLVETLTVSWPSGKRQTWRGVAVDREMIAVEGAEELRMF